MRGTLVVLVNELSGVWLLGGTQMSDEIRVTVIRYPDRANLVLAYTDPVSGKRQTKSAGT